MKPVLIGGDVWRYEFVRENDPKLIDRTGELKLATTDPTSRVISLSRAIAPPLIDSVLLHETAHAITISYGLLSSLHKALPEDAWVFAEEWAVGLVERFSAEALAAAGSVLGRPLCIRGFCTKFF